MDTETTTPTPSAQTLMPRGLFVFSLLYGGMAVLAGFLAFKQVQLPFTELAVEAGIFAFLILVVVSSTISQVYGDAVARKLVWWGFLPLAVSAVLIFLVLSLPASPEMLEFRSTDLAAFETVLSQTPRIMAAGPAAYLVSLLLNVWLFSRLRGNAEGESSTMGLMIRGGIASALSQAIDSVIFVTLAFYGEFDITNLLIGQVIAKVVLSLVLVPPLIALFVRIARRLG